MVIKLFKLQKKTTPITVAKRTAKDLIKKEKKKLIEQKKSDKLRVKEIKLSNKLDSIKNKNFLIVLNLKTKRLLKKPLAKLVVDYIKAYNHPRFDTYNKPGFSSGLKKYIINETLESLIDNMDKFKNIETSFDLERVFKEILKR